MTSTLYAMDELCSLQCYCVCVHTMCMPGSESSAKITRAT